MKKATCIMIFLCAAFSIFSTAQSKPEMLNNKLIVDMHKAGLSTETIVTKILSSSASFDLSTTALIALKKQGIPDEIMKAMINKTDPKGASRPPGSTQAQSSAIKRGLNIEPLNYIHTYYHDTIKPLERSMAASQSKRKALGYGGSNLTLEIDGASSPLKLSENQAEAFVINMGGNTLPDLVLYKLKVEKNKREVVVGKLTTSGPKSGDKVISVEITKLSDGIFILKPGQKLERGEYFFANKPNLNASTSSVEVYAFSII